MRVVWYLLISCLALAGASTAGRKISPVPNTKAISSLVARVSLQRWCSSTSS